MTDDTRVDVVHAPNLTGKALLSYGLFGLPLAMVAMPVYVQAPALYAGSFGLSLTLVGTILLVARLLDAFSDPLLGYWMDRSSATRGYAGFVLMSLPLLVAGYLALFHPPASIVNDITSLSAWFAGSLGLVYLGFSLATIAHNSWGASLTQLRGERARLTAFREGFGLIGVMIAAAVPTLTGMNALSMTFVIALSITSWLLIRHAPRARALAPVSDDWRALIVPLQNTKFRWLLGVFAISGIAAAIPATLFLFFATDRLLLAQYAGLFLVIYFAAAALAHLQ
jgi:Na+/melibiose symporter-like transporter